jgi:hypothetical protein
LFDRIVAKNGYPESEVGKMLAVPVQFLVSIVNSFTGKYSYDVCINCKDMSRFYNSTNEHKKLHLPVYF